MINKSISVAFCGTRGIPASYGGFETAVDEISKRMVDQGIDCTVFCRTESLDNVEDTYQGRKRIFIKGSKSRKLDTFISSINTGIYLLKNRKKFQYVYWFNNANVLGIMLTRIANIPMAINTDGLEWRRAKWSFPFKAFYFFSSMLISLTCKNLISDSVAIQSYYRKKFFKKTIFIAYGAANIPDVSHEYFNDTLSKYDLNENKYFLQITRFEPDNLPLEIVQKFYQTDLFERGYKFVVIGYKDETNYMKSIMKYNGKRGIVVLPANYDSKELYCLRQGAFSYVHGNSVGGTNPALLEAMQSCKRVMAIEGAFSREVLGEGQGCYFTLSSLTEDFESLLKMDNQSQKMLNRIKSDYDWTIVSHAYSKLIKFAGIESYRAQSSASAPIDT